MIDTLAIVIENAEPVPGYRLLTLEYSEEFAAAPGQFAMLRSHGSAEPLLRRALAVYQVQSPSRVSFLYQVLGRGTQVLSALHPGDVVESLGPLGNRWPLPEAGRAILVAGGIGSASLLMLAAELLHTGIETSVFFGAASQSAAIGCGLRDFEALRLPLTITTDDGSLGEAGFVTAPLERHLRSNGAVGVSLYACGPWPMMARTAQICDSAGAPCLVSLEAPMGCGFGVCVGCVFAVKAEGPSGYGTYKRVCVDGSIFPASVVDWQVNAMSH
jgi:dihydroorotate dehydrogenase electron transfer subunit